MEHTEFRKKFMYMDIGEGIINCVDDDVTEGIDNLSKLVEKSQGYLESNKQLFEQFRAIPRYTGFVVNNKLGEDNLFYDLNISGYENQNTEHIDEELNPMFDDINSKLNQLLIDVRNTYTAVQLYRRKNGLEEKIKLNLKELLGGEFNDAKFTADELLAMDITAIAAAYGLDADKLQKFLDEKQKGEKSIDEILSETFGDKYNNLSDEKKEKFKETADYISDGFNKDKEELSVGKMGESAEKVSLYKDEERLSAANNNEVNENAVASESNDVQSESNTNNTATSGNNGTSASKTSSGSSDEVYIGSASASMESPQYGPNQGEVTYRRTSSTPVPATSNVENTSISEHKSEMQEATEKTKNTTAFQERDEYEARIAAEQKAQEDANNAQAAKDEADHAQKVAEQTKQVETTKQTVQTNETPATNSVTEDFTQSTVENVTPTQQTTETVSNPQPAISMPDNVVANNATTTTTTSTVPEIKDMISNGKTTVEKVASATKVDASKMVSSVTSNSTPLKPITVDNSNTTTETTTAGKFVPPIAGVSTAAVAGIGAKLYMDKKDNKEDKKEEKHENKFFDESIKQEEESKLNFSSKEDIIRLLDR